MANIYYSDTLGTNLNVFEKKTNKGGEPFYFIYLNKTKITESDVKVKLLGVMQFASPTTLNIKVKEGKMAWTVSWSYTKPTSLADQQKLFDEMFTWLKNYGYVDNYQGRGKRASSVSKTSSTPQLPNLTNAQGIPLINIQSPSVIKKGDLFYFYLSLESPCYVSEFDQNTNTFYFTRYVKPNSPQYETIGEPTLRKFIKDDEAFLCKTTDGGFFENNENTFSLMIEPMKSDGSFEMVINEDGAIRKGGLPNEEQLAMFILANKLMPKLPNKNVVKVQQMTTTTSSTNIDFRFNDLIWLVDDPYSIERVVSPPYQELVCSVYNPTYDKFVDVRYDINLINSNIQNGLVIRKRLEEGDIFETRLGNVQKTITKIEKKGQGRNVTYSDGGNIVTTTELDFIEGVQEMEMKWLTTNMVASTSTTPMQVGDKFIYSEIPNNPTQKEKEDIRTVVKVHLSSEELDFEALNGTRINGVTFSLVRKLIDDGELILLNNSNQSAQPQASSNITQLEIYDLINRVGDGKLFRILNVEGLFAQNNTFYNIPDNALVNLQDYDAIARDFQMQQIRFVDLKNNFFRGELNYLGRVRIGDSFIAQSNNMERLVVDVNGFGDVTFKISDANFTPPKILNVDNLVMNVFTKGLLQQGYKFNLRLGNTPTQNQLKNLPLDNKLLQLDLFERSSDKELNFVSSVSVGANILNLKDGDKVNLKYLNVNTKNLSDYLIDFNTLKDSVEIGSYTYLGQLKVGDTFEGTSMQRVVTQILDKYNSDSVFFNINDLNYTPPKFLADGVNTKRAFLEDTLKQGYKLVSRLDMGTTTPTPQVATNVTPKPQISDSEIDALKKDLSDMVFLRSGISDLEFEEKINISTDIFETQKKINDLTEKLFEQKVGDENFFDRLFEQSFTPLKNRYDTTILPNDLDEIISPSGEKSNLGEPLQKIVNSQSFKEWFGDWRNAYFYRNLPDFGGLNISKVLNDKFEPQLVWHGTNNEFSYFDFEMFPANYFAVNKEYSEFFATFKSSNGQGYVLPFFLDIKNPLDLTDFGKDYVSSKDFFDFMYLMTGMSGEELEANPMVLDPNWVKPIWMYIRNNPTMIKKIAQGRVYDGIKFYEFNPNEDGNPKKLPLEIWKKQYETLAYIIFDPHQAKLADPNRGDILLASLKSFMLKRGGKI